VALVGLRKTSCVVRPREREESAIRKTTGKKAFREDGGVEWEEDGPKRQSVRLCLFVGFTDVSVDFETLGIPGAGRRGRKFEESEVVERAKNHQNGDVCRRERKKAGREEGNICRECGCRLWEIERRGEGLRGRRGESALARLLPRLRGAAALLSGRRGR
jgi:hypothetical protein